MSKNNKSAVSPRALQRFSKVVKDNIKSKRQSLGMSICLVEFMANSPLSWLPPSPRLSPNTFLHKKKSLPDPLPLEQAHQTPSSPANVHSGSDRSEMQQEYGSPAEEKVSNPPPNGEIWKKEANLNLSNAQSNVGRNWREEARLAMLLVMLMSGCVSIFKTAAFRIASLAFAVLELAKLAKLSLFCHFHSPLFVSVCASENEMAGQLVQNQEVCDTKVGTMAEESKKKKIRGRLFPLSVYLPVASCIKEIANEFLEKEKACQGQAALATNESKKKKMRSSLRSLSLQVPRRRLSPFTVSAPSTPTTSNDGPTCLNRVITGEPPFSTPASPIRRIGSTSNLSCSETSLLSNQTNGLYASDLRQLTAELPMRRATRLGLEQAKEQDDYNTWSRVAAAILVILGGLLLGRVAAVIGASSWMFLTARRRSRRS